MVEGDQSAIFDRPEHFLSLGLALAQQGKAGAVRELIGETLGRHQGKQLYHQLARFILARSIPPYHEEMLLDGARNSAYRRAIEAAAPGKVVLDIGTGTSLLAMMAARAGARRVIACEMVPALAETARRIIAANGLSDKIEVYGCHSTQLDRAKLFPDGVDVVVSEILSANGLGEGVLETLAHARQELCAPGAVFIPQSVELRVALAEYSAPERAIGEVEGFNLSLFADHGALVTPLANCDADLALLSTPATLGRFDFTEGGKLAVTGQMRSVVEARQGSARGVAQWLRVDFGNGVTYENSPGSDKTAHWCVMAYPFAEPAKLMQGQSVAIHGFHHGDALVIWPGNKEG